MRMRTHLSPDTSIVTSSALSSSAWVLLLSLVVAVPIVAHTADFGQGLAPPVPLQATVPVAGGGHHSVAAGTLAVSFHNQGLPRGTAWSVSLNGTQQNGTGGSLSFYVPNGVYSFTIGPSSGYLPIPASGTVTVAGRGLDETINFVEVAVGSYLLTLSESGLPLGHGWSVSVNGTVESSSGTTIQFAGVNGTYWFSVGPLANYVATPASSSFSIAGSATARSLIFAALAHGTYPVTFSESGLPVGTSWSIDLNGTNATSTGPSMVFEVANGTLTYLVRTVAGYSANPISGDLPVAGLPTTQLVTFTVSDLKLYSIVFNQTGLPAGTMWSVTLNGTTLRTTLEQVTLDEPKGVYVFTVGAIPGYTSTPASSKVAVLDQLVLVPIFYWVVLPGSHVLTFTETGLPFGASWSVAIGTTTIQSAGPTQTFTERGGTYGFTVGAISGYVATPASGTLTVADGDLNLTVAFSALSRGTYVLEFTESNLPLGTSWSVTANGETAYSTGATITFAERNATVRFTVPAVAGWSANRSSGSTIVDGSDVSEAVSFQGPPLAAGLLRLPGNNGAYLLAGIIALVIVAAAAGTVLFRRGKRPSERGITEAGQSQGPPL